MIEELYTIISIFVAGSILLTFGLCFLFLSMPENPLLRNYLCTRYIMACAYLFLAVGNVAEYFSRSPDDNTQLTQMITLVIGCSQSFLFTYVFITLINPTFLSGQKIAGKISLFLGLVAALFAVYYVCPAEWFNALLGVYLLIYGFLLVRFTRMFLANYRCYRTRMDNYYADEEAQRMRWVLVSFFAALAIGVLAMLNAMFMSELGALLFSVVMIAFYFVFGIRFLNYPVLFRYIETAVMPDESEDKTAVPESDDDISARMQQWTAARHYLTPALVIDKVAEQMGVPRKKLSAQINQSYGFNFNTWINTLRIEHAKQLLANPDNHFSLDSLSEEVGYRDKSHFLRQFRQYTGQTPAKWRDEQRNNVPQ